MLEAFMRNWMRDRLMKRKKKDGDSEKSSSEQPKQAPLQPDFYDAQGAAPVREVAPVREAAPSHAEPTQPDPIDDDNRWNRIDHSEPPAPRRAVPQRSQRSAAPRSASPSAEVQDPGPLVEASGPDSPARTERSTEGREAGPNRGRRRRGRRGRGRAKPAEISADGASVAAPLRPSPMSDPMQHAAQDTDAAPHRRGPVRTAAEASQAAAPLEPAAPKKYKGVVVLSIGLPGSGKSSWFKRNNITPLSSDLLRGLLFDDPNEQRFQDLVFSNLRSLLRARLVARRPMNYVDATNLSPHERQGWIKLAHDYGYEVHAVFFDVPLEVCLDRNRKRQRVVAEDVMRRMGSKLQPPTFEEGFTKITNVRVKKKEGEEAMSAAPSASISAGSDTPEEIGVSAEAVE
jgi:predicted kinase